MDAMIFLSQLQQLPQMLLWVRERLGRAGVDSKQKLRIELAMEEALVNVIRHAYGEKVGKIEIFFRSDGSQVEITICDWGPPFDPLAGAPEVSIDATLEEREIGGLGVYLMRQLMDEVRYAREGTTNLLTLIKRFSQMQ
jgi:serine/threonine-protein kinase RsbW